MVRTGEERGAASGAGITAIFGATARAVRPPMDLIAPPLGSWTSGE
ncbi:hypothetical protein [Mycobacterium marinum]|nr:hypothetical protein [Mycobacterium marinum]WCS18955.1 hypothetical protein MML61_03325 [Mycobacterium marinum]WOR05268.1 hypothetical protein QDR78_03205 [Mycobacterium marinum]